VVYICVKYLIGEQFVKIGQTSIPFGALIKTGRFEGKPSFLKTGEPYRLADNNENNIFKVTDEDTFDLSF